MLIKEFFQYGFDFAEIIVSKVRFFYSAVSNKLLSLTPRYINDTAEPDSAVAIAPAESDSAVSTTSSEFLTCKKISENSKPYAKILHLMITGLGPDGLELRKHEGNNLVTRLL